jgi:redox-sensitive bicupin YhaK (pirin superfamily)
VEAGGAQVRVLIGDAFGERSPVATFSRTVYLDVRLAAGATLELPQLAQELAIYPVEGDLAVSGESLPARCMGVLAQGPNTVAANAPSRFVVVGGDALEVPRFMWWNFVTSRKERVQQAADDWKAGRMGTVAGDDEFIPLPPTPFTPPEPRS